MSSYSHESIDHIVCSSSVVRRGRILLGRPCFRRRRRRFNPGDMPYRLLHGRIPPHENVTEYRASVPCKGSSSLKPPYHYENIVHIGSDFRERTLGNQSNTERVAERQIGGPRGWQTILSGVPSAGSVRSKFRARIR